MEQKNIRCAIYTRKSTEEGLDKEFNTLEAQREAGENYVKSQKEEGWVLLPKHYDDGGYSGGNMKRPALQELFEDIKAEKVDMIVVYKIDRLTRSLLDFSKMVELFTQYNISFVSVTQHFNTCDSMGKLTLNILLSFAQFERELSGERIRDKFEASKKKGMWMGGSLPLGYDSKNKKLVINPEEAQIVKFLFNDYLITHSEIATCKNANAAGYRSKFHISRCGNTHGGALFTRVMVSNILKNPVYIGKCIYKKELFDGQHKPIISQEVWDKVQNIKKLNRGNRFAPSNSFKNALLKGLVECECCGGMTPTRSKRNNKYYEYYTSCKAIHEGYATCKVGSIPAAELDNFVIEKVQMIFQSPEIIQELANQIKPSHPEIGEREIFDMVYNIKQVFAHFSPATIQNIVKKIVNRVIVGKGYIKIRFSSFGIKYIDNELKLKEHGYTPKEFEFTYEVALHRKCGRVVIVQPGTPQTPIQDKLLINAVAHAFQLKLQLEQSGITIRELSQRLHYNRSYMARILRLTLLSPTIISSIIDGTQPRDLKIEDFTRDDIPYLWTDQLKKYGYA